MLLYHGGAGSSLKKIHHHSAYWSAITHDFEHGGLNNDFLIKTAHPLAITYNDQSPLENHHLSAAVRVLHHPDNCYHPVSCSACCPTNSLYRYNKDMTLSCLTCYVASVGKTEMSTVMFLWLNSSCTCQLIAVVFLVTCLLRYIGCLGFIVSTGGVLLNGPEPSCLVCRQLSSRQMSC